MTEYCGDHGGTNSEGEPCGNEAGWGTPTDGGKCKHHRGTSPDGSSHEGNDWAATHGAYSESFVTDFLTDEEIERVRKAQEILETPEGAQADARLMAAISKEQFRRTGDERFLRRYESICETAGIFPDDELRVEHSGTVDHEHSHDLSRTEKARLDQLLGGSGAVDVDPVDTIDE